MPEGRQAGSISRTLLLPYESRGTLRLRHQLAEDGCKESQLALAKSLLTGPASSSEDRNFNSQLAVYWLLQAANKGQEEAVTLLKHCANSGIGVNAINFLEIEKCLNYTEENKISRRVAFAVFGAIMSDTEDLVPEDIFREKIERILQEAGGEPAVIKSKEEQVFSKEPVPEKQTDDAALRNQAHVSFSEVVNSVQSCLEGNVPLVSLKQVAHINEYKWLATKYICILWNLLLKSFESVIQSLATLILPVSVLLLRVLLEIATSLSTPGSEMNLLLSNCKILFTVLLCLFAMLSSTCFVIYISFGGDNMKKWLHLIKFFEPNIKSEEIERKYLMKTAYPLLTFLLVCVMYIIVFSLISVQSSFADLGIMCFVLMFLVDRTITHQRYYVNISFILNALTCLYKTNMLQKLSFSSFSFLDFNIVYELGRNFQIHLNFLSFLALPFVLPYLYTKMALGNEGKGWHLVLLPHLMSVTWMNLASIHLANAENPHVFLSLFSWLAVMVFSHYFGIVLTVTVYLLLKMILVSGYLNFEVLLLVPAFGILYVLSLFLIKKFKISNERKLCSLVLCLCIIVLSYQATKPQTSYVDDSSSNILSWDKYEKHCHHHAWYRTNPAEVQISCLPLKGRKISFEGMITSIDVIKVHNSIQVIADMLPNPLHIWLTCGLGKRYIACDAENITPTEKEHCLLYESLNITECHLHNWDEYKYQIMMEVSTRTSPEIALIADHICSSFVRNIKEGDSLRVIGVLESNIGATVPKFHVQNVVCTNCYSNVECNISSAMPQPNYALSVKNIVWFYFSPFIQYKLKST